MTVDREFFLSFAGADRPWAAWLLAELDDAGYSSVSQLRDFVAGSNFMVAMDQAARRARRTLGVLSATALRAPYVRQEWAQRLASDPTGEQRALVLVRVEPCEPEGLLGPVVYLDLVGLDEEDARARLREELAAVVRGQRPLPANQQFPGGSPRAVVADVGRPRFPTALPPVWNLPYRRNPTFTGREAELATLAHQLGQVRTAAITQVIHGGGGIGKTTLAAEYAWRHRAEFEVVWWVRAEEPATLVGDYAELAAALGLAEAALAEQQAVVRAVRRWLQGHDRWLLVLDNAEGPQAATGLLAPLAHLVDLLPQAISEHGQVLVTTRDASWEHETPLLDLDLLTPEEAVRFLLARTASSDQPAAAETAATLGYLPLALEQAGAYVAETRIGLAAYLERLRRFPALALAKGRPRDRDPTDTVASTWQISLERVRPVAGAVALLEVCAFLAPEDIPRDLFAQQLEQPIQLPELAPVAADPFALDAAVAALRRYGLVKADEHTLSVHRLLQQVVRDRLGPDTAATRIGLAVRLVAAALPRTEYREPRLWPIYARLLPHALAAADHAEQHATEPDTTVTLLGRSGSYLMERTQFWEAKALFARALALTEATYGPDHPETTEYLRRLGQVVGYLRDGALARQQLERSLAIDQAAYGPDHPNIVVDLLRLGELLRNLEELALARQYVERALTIAEAGWGADHRRLAVIYLNLGYVFHRLKDLGAARQWYARALASFETAWGADHVYVATALRGLGGVLRDQGDVAAARRHFERALAIFEVTQGPDHIDVGSVLADLGLVLRDLGDLAAARQHLERALAIREAHLGPDHPDTVRSRRDVAAVVSGSDNRE